MAELAAHLTQSEEAYRPVYFGMPATGRPAEREALGLSGKKYCLGLGYIVNEAVLKVLASNVELCLGRVASNHSGEEGAFLFDKNDMA